MDAKFETFVGVDIAKDSLDVCFLAADKRFTTTNDQAGFDNCSKSCRRSVAA